MYKVVGFALGEQQKGAERDHSAAFVQLKAMGRSSVLVRCLDELKYSRINLAGSS